MRSLAQSAFLVFCWAAAFTTLLIFLKTWVSRVGPNRFLARRASGAYGVVTVFVTMRGSISKVEETIRSIFGQSYPFIELVLTYPEEDKKLASLAREFRSARSHVPVRLVPTLFAIDSENDRIRALDHALPGVRGRWFVVIEPDVVLDRFAIETALEFAGSNDISALVLTPGVRCRSAIQRLLAPSMEQFARTSQPATPHPAFFLVHREPFEHVNRVNRMPGILNDAAWSVWGYQVEGVRTFEADGARWIWRDTDVRSWPSPARPAWFVVAAAIMPAVAVIGMPYGLTLPLDTFTAISILSSSAITYVVMSVSYFLFARSLGTAPWFAPLWFLSHVPAAVLTLAQICSSAEAQRTSHIDGRRFQPR